jgi:hypothetical protein
MQLLLKHIIEQPMLHARWLNTLSMMENTGAKKIKRCEHPVFVSEIILKHSAEEARHAYYLKRQIQKIGSNICPTYEQEYLLAPKSSYAYLHKLDIDVCRYLKSKYDLRQEKLKYAAYLLVTYAIEVRADELYPQYQEALREQGSAVSVKNIIAEEKNHLEEMQAQLRVFSPEWEQMCADVCRIESGLYDNWIKDLEDKLRLNGN